MLKTNITPVDKDLIIQQATTKAYEVQITKNGRSENITGWTISFLVKERLNDTDGDAVINKVITTHSDAENGKSLIRLETTDTDITPKSYYYAIKFIDAGSPVNKGIIVRGRLVIEKTV